MKAREKRIPVRLSARMRSNLGWSDTLIQNVSSRGMLLSSDEVPATGSYVEIRRDAVVVIGRIVWRNGQTFGIRTQDRINLKALIAPPRAGPTQDAFTGDRLERRQAARDVTADRSRHLGRMLQYAFLLSAVGAGAIALVGSVANALAPLRAVQSHLIGN